MNKELEALERKLEIRNGELAEAHRHIAALEEKLLKLKQYRRELKSLKDERRRCANPPNAGLARYCSRPIGFWKNLPKQFGENFISRSRTLGNSVAPSEYQKWFRASSCEYGGLGLDAP